MSENKRNFKKNVIVGFGGQLIIIVLGIIIPRVMITNYGSDINGLVSTITQIFTYMALLEAGIGQASRNELFKPISENNRSEISKVLSVSQQYYRKITIIYGLGVLALATILPGILKSNVDWLTIFLVVIFEGLSGVVSFYFIETITVMLTVDGKGYINNEIAVVNRILTYVVKIVMAYLGINIAILQLAFFVLSVLKVFVYKAYFKKHYSWVELTKASDDHKLKDRNAYVITEMAWTIFSSTDMIVLSIFISTSISSVYSVYNMIFSNLNVLLNGVYGNICYMLGQKYHEDLKEYEKIHDSFTTLFLGGMTIMMCTAYLLCIPFVKLYTHGVTDIEYIYEGLPLLFCLTQLLSWSRYVSGNLTGIAGYAKQTSWISMTEAIINLVASVLLVNRYGILGVLFATVIALPLKVLWCVYISDRKVMKRSYFKSIKIMGGNYLVFFATVMLGNKLNITAENYIQFAFVGLLCFVAVSIVGIAVNVLMNPTFVQYAKKLKR